MIQPIITITLFVFFSCINLSDAASIKIEDLIGQNIRQTDVQDKINKITSTKPTISPPRHNNDYSVSYKKDGIEFLCNSENIIDTIFLNFKSDSYYKGFLPKDIKQSYGVSEVKAKLGTPDYHDIKKDFMTGNPVMDTKTKKPVELLRYVFTAYVIFIDIADNNIQSFTIAKPSKGNH